MSSKLQTLKNMTIGHLFELFILAAFMVSGYFIKQEYDKIKALPEDLTTLVQDVETLKKDVSHLSTTVNSIHVRIEHLKDTIVKKEDVVKIDQVVEDLRKALVREQLRLHTLESTINNHITHTGASVDAPPPIIVGSEGPGTGNPAAASVPSSIPGTLNPHAVDLLERFDMPSSVTR